MSRRFCTKSSLQFSRKSSHVTRVKISVRRAQPLRSRRRIYVHVHNGWRSAVRGWGEGEGGKKTKSKEDGNKERTRRRRRRRRIQTQGDRAASRPRYRVFFGPVGAAIPPLCYGRRRRRPRYTRYMCACSFTAAGGSGGATGRQGDTHGRASFVAYNNVLYFITNARHGRGARRRRRRRRRQLLRRRRRTYTRACARRD